jgi:hypothetical protein
MSLEFSTTRALVDGKELNMGFLSLDNAVLYFLWEGVKPVLGTLTVSLPGRVSSTLLGDKDSMLGSILGDQLSSFFQKMTLVSTNLKTLRGQSVGKRVLEITRETFMKRDTK